MVKAKLAGTKTQTRRAVKPQPVNRVVLVQSPPRSSYCPSGGEVVPYDTNGMHPGTIIRCPYGRVGDGLYGKETFRPRCDDELMDVVEYRADMGRLKAGMEISENEGWAFSQDCDDAERKPGDFGYNPKSLRWRPSIFMPRWAARIRDIITDIRVEQLQDISEADAAAEGCIPCMEHSEGCKDDQCALAGGPDDCDGSMVSAKMLYRVLWESINGPGSWEANPWVWAITTKPFQA